MFAVIFLVEPKPECWDDYLAQAADLRPDLGQIDGFLDNRRFTSRRHPGRLLSLSFWRDESAIVQWRTNPNHHSAQKLGRQSIFRDYRLYVGEVVRDGGADRPRSPGDEAGIGRARAVSLIEEPATEPPANALDWDMFDGITVAGSTLMVLFWPNIFAMSGQSPVAGASRKDVRVIRDYGLTDRREAPQ